MTSPVYALSLRQPWAALLATGLKTVEVRHWPTACRGHVLIHAARRGDPRPQPWTRVTAAIRALAELRGGIIGEGDLVGCLSYDDAERFAGDRDRHLNDPSWFEPPILYGFSFRSLRVVAFRALAGNTRFFRVPDLEREQQ